MKLENILENAREKKQIEFSKLRTMKHMKIGIKRGSNKIEHHPYLTNSARGTRPRTPMKEICQKKKKREIPHQLEYVKFVFLNMLREQYMLYPYVEPKFSSSFCGTFCHNFCTKASSLLSHFLHSHQKSISCTSH